MGLRASLVGVKDAEKNDVLNQLGLVETGEYAFDVVPELSCAVAPSGWVIVMGPEDFATPERLTLLSSKSEAVGLIASETVMVNEAHGYRDGARIWSVTYDPDRGERDLEVEGEPPAQLAAIRKNLLRQQVEEEEGGVLLFEAAIELVDAVCGFRWDQASDDGEAVFKVVEHAKSGAAGEEQARRRAFRDALTACVEGELYAHARALGFVPLGEAPEFLEHHFPGTLFNTLVRRRDDGWDSLQFVWTVEDETPYVDIFFFVRPLRERRRGRQGRAYLPRPHRSWLDRFLPRKEAPPETLDSVIEKMKGVIAEVDAQMRDGTPSPRIIPPVYED